MPAGKTVSTDMFRDGRATVGTLPDALGRIIKAYQQTGRVQVVSGLLGEGTQVLMVCGHTHQIGPLVLDAVHLREGIKTLVKP